MLVTKIDPSRPLRLDLDQESTVVVVDSLLVNDVLARVRRSTHDRIRNLSVVEAEGRFVVSGEVSSQHMRQLALHGALEVLSGEQFASKIVVNTHRAGVPTRV